MDWESKSLKTLRKELADQEAALEADREARNRRRVQIVGEALARGFAHLTNVEPFQQHLDENDKELFDVEVLEVDGWRVQDDEWLGPRERPPIDRPPPYPTTLATTRGQGGTVSPSPAASTVSAADLRADAQERAAWRARFEWHQKMNNHLGWNSRQARRAHFIGVHFVHAFQTDPAWRDKLRRALDGEDLEIFKEDLTVLDRWVE